MAPPTPADDSDPPAVLAIASHVTYGYVGNKMAAFAMQTLGWDVSAINTVAFSNHTAYGRHAGRRTPAAELTALFDGLVAARLAAFDVLLSGYTPAADGVRALGAIAAALRAAAGPSFFWVLDPVMGDNGALYVDADIPAAYTALLSQADLVLPNAFEAATLTGSPVTSIASAARALGTLHARHGVPHAVITSLALGADALAVVGSSGTRAGAARAFAVRVPRHPLFFSGTGDLFAALLAVRLREASGAAGLLGARGWRPADGVRAADTPLAAAVRRALQSVHAILAATAARVARGPDTGGDGEAARLARARASEVRVVQFAEEMRWPERQGVELVLETPGADE